MSENVHYKVLLDLLEMHPKSKYEQKVLHIVFNILYNILVGQDCGTFLISQMSDRVVKTF